MNEPTTWAQWLLGRSWASSARKSALTTVSKFHTGGSNPADVARRRAANKVARRSRRINRLRAK